MLLGVLSLDFAIAGVLPRLEARTLAGGSIVLPEDAHGSFALLVFGFTRGSREWTSAWGRRSVQDCKPVNHCQDYAIAVLEDVPRLLRSIVVSGIRAGIPAERQGYFLTLFHDSDAWKKFVGYREPDDAYLVLLDADGNVRWRWHGIFNDANYAIFQQELREIGVSRINELHCCRARRGTPA